MFPILPALILFLMQAHAGGDRSALPLLDAWRVQAITRGIDRETVRQVSGVLLHQLRKEQIQIAPIEKDGGENPFHVLAPARSLAELNAEVQRSRDGPNGL